MMKSIKLLIGFWAVLALFSCSEDDKVTLSSDPIAPILENLSVNSFELLEENQDDTMAVFTYTAADFGASVLINYILQVDTLGGDYSAAVEVGVPANAITQAISVKDFNTALSTLGLKPKQAYNLQVRIRAYLADPAETSVYSNSIELSATPYAGLPENIYMIGDAIGSWDWDSDQIIEMIPVASDDDPSVFWAIAYLEAGKGFKFNSEKAWDGNDFGADDATNDGALGIKDKGTTNITTPATSGYYMVVVNAANEKILITNAEVYAMGNTVGGWDPYEADNLFTIDNTAQEFTLTREFFANELRLYAAARWEGEDWLSDWWRSEFIFFADGIIEYRGAGGDQDRYTISAGVQTITLNFEEGTGSISAE